MLRLVGRYSGDLAHTRCHLALAGPRLAKNSRWEPVTDSSHIDCAVQIFDGTQGERRVSMDLNALEATSIKIKWSPDGSRIATVTAGDDTLRLWDLADGALILAFNLETDITAATFSPDMTQMATASRSEIIQLWNIEEEQEANRLEGAVAEFISWSPKDTMLAFGASIWQSDTSIVQFWDGIAADTQLTMEFEGNLEKTCLVT